jgi:hypothetical protein
VPADVSQPVGDLQLAMGGLVRGQVQPFNRHSIAVQADTHEHLSKSASWTKRLLVIELPLPSRDPDRDHVKRILS